MCLFAPPPSWPSSHTCVTLYGALMDLPYGMCPLAHLICAYDIAWHPCGSALWHVHNTIAHPHLPMPTSYACICPIASSHASMCLPKPMGGYFFFFLPFLLMFMTICTCLHMSGYTSLCPLAPAHLICMHNIIWHSQVHLMAYMLHHLMHPH